MADPIVSALASTILGNLNSSALCEVATVFGLTTEVQNLRSSLSAIQAVLHDAEEKQWKDLAVKDWLRKLKDVAYEVDDLLDECVIQAQRPGNWDLKSRVRSFFSLQNPLLFRVNMAHKLQSVKQRLDVIASQKQQFHLREGAIGGDNKEGGVLDWRLTSSLVKESDIIGREKEKEELISMVLEASSQDISVYAIWGMGGLGKTTLAQLTYNDGRIKNHFDLRIWICVSDDFDLRRLIRDIIESIDGSPPSIEGLDVLQRELQKKLSGKKFLLVLDDVWNENHDKWEALNNSIRCGATGSAVIVTTRSQKIACMMAAVPAVYSLEILSEDDSWSVFQHWAFESRKKEEFDHLEAIGRAIANKCGGVPLAIKAMGRLMRLKTTESEWKSIRESEIWELSEEEGSMNILPALRLSYNHLPQNLKQCFAFCSVFPKDYKMEKDRLIGLWMANGFITCKGHMDLYDKAREAFGELVWRSFFQDVEEDLLGNTTCKMHDLIHDLARSISKDECSQIEHDKVSEVSKLVRHVSTYNSLKSFPQCKNLFKDQSLRSLLQIDHYVYDQYQQLCYSLLSGQKHLRILDLSHLEKLPMSVDRLKHLRYLGLPMSDLRSLPESTTSLQNLQTLNLKGCNRLNKLPRGMKQMKSLIQLDISGCDSLRYMPGDIGELRRLRKLNKFIVGKHKGQGIGELKELNIGGELIISNLYYVKSIRDAKSANLMHKEDLKSLELISSSEEVLEGLQPHSNLRRLEIKNYRGSKIPNWMMNLQLLPNVVEIKLANFKYLRCEKLPPCGKLKFLKKLSLGGNEWVKRIGNEIYGEETETCSFPSLESLDLRWMTGLEAWEESGSDRGRDVFPVLRDLNITRCPKLVELPIIPSVKRLEIKIGSNRSIKSVENFTNVTTLILDSQVEAPEDRLTHLPDGMLRNHLLLEHLEIHFLSRLRSLSNIEIHNLSALKSLELSRCEELESLPEGLCSLNSLQTIKVDNCGIKSFPSINEFGGLSSLRRLTFTDCKELESLSEGVRHLTALEGLYIAHCPELNSLPESMGHLTSLSNLDVYYCPKLMRLPDGIRHLNNLRDLSIVKCPNLLRRCERDRGEDWPNIAHIPKIFIR